MSDCMAEVCPTVCAYLQQPSLEGRSGTGGVAVFQILSHSPTHFYACSWIGLSSEIFINNLLTLVSKNRTNLSRKILVLNLHI